MSLRLIQLNIQGSKHLDRFLPFLLHCAPDVVCVQELRDTDIERITNTLTMSHLFMPMARIAQENTQIYSGLGIFSRMPMVHHDIQYYAGCSEIVTDFDGTSAESKRTSQRFGVLSCDIKKEDVTYRIATTHFTWSPDGLTTADQLEDVQKLLTVLADHKEFILTGDFNAPRGKEVFTALASRYTDHVPKKYTSSIDPTLHRAGPLELMVDGILSTPHYQISDVHMVCGLSDHCALTATISKIG